MKKKGFTLVELLAVIIILAVIALIATPLVLNVVDSAKKSAFESSAYGVIESAKMNSMENLLNDGSMEAVYTFPNSGIDVQGEQPTGGEIRITNEGKISVTVHNGKWCAIKEYDDEIVTIKDYVEGECKLLEEVEDVCYEVDVIKSYDFNEGNCITVFSNIFGSATTTNEVELFCTDGGSVQGVTLDMYMSMLTNEEQIEMGLVENVVYEKQCKSCFEYAYIGTTFELDYDGCKEFMQPNGYTEEELETLCTGGTIDDGYSVYEIVKNNPANMNLFESMRLVKNVKYSKTEIGITKYNCNVGNTLGYPTITDVSIPNKIDGKYVVAIGMETFSEKELTSVKLPETLEIIGTSAFSTNKINSELDLSNTKVTTISQLAFSNNEITSIKLPETLETIGDSAFYINKISDELDLSNTKVTTIAGSTFSDNQITSVKLPETLKAIGDSAFADNRITSIKMPERLEIIGNGAFSANKINGELDLSNTKVTTIGEWAFPYNEIASIKLPTSIESIGRAAFSKSNTIAGNMGIEYTDNITLTRIVNPSGNSFNWSNITDSSTSNQNFITGTIVHSIGDITVTDK